MLDFGHDFLSFLTLLFLEIILGIDNLVFVSIASQSLPKHQQKKARQLGLIAALGTRLLLLMFLNKLAGFTHKLFSIKSFDFSLRDLVLCLGGLFLLYKSTEEIHGEFSTASASAPKVHKQLMIVILQIGILDIVFSLDSVITAIAMTDKLLIMCLAIIAAMITMIFASNPLSDFIVKHPSIKMLALSFILMIGTMIIADGFHFHIPRAYIYFAITFSLFVETLNILAHRRRTKT
jgi:predicted tellurium resistance membrane protein TerC